MCEHEWTRTNGATLEDGGDTFKCDKCHATGKSHGLVGLIVEDRSNTREGGRDYKAEYQGRKRRELIKKLRQSQGLQWSEEQYRKRQGHRID